MAMNLSPKYNSLGWILIRATSISVGTFSYAFQLNSMNDALSTMLRVFEIS